MKINILLPFKELFDENKASSVSITIKNNLFYTNYLKNIQIFGQQTKNPMFKENFRGIRYSYWSLKSKNEYLLDEMLKNVFANNEKNQIIEIHNRPYLIKKITKKTNNFPISLFLHNDPKTMRGSKSVYERVNIIRKCEAVFCVSEYIKKQFMDGISCNSNKVHVLFNGVERKLKKFPKKRKEILFVGRLVFEKGAHIYVDVIKSLAPQFPDWNFSLIGSTKLGDNKNLNSYTLKLIENFNKVGSQAKFYGFKDHDFVQEKMKEVSIITIPSLWPEPFGLVAAEAMSNGIAIVASKVGGIPEIINDNGILIEDINYSKLKKEVALLINDDKKRYLLQKKSWNNFTLSSENSSKKLDKYREMIFKNYF